MKFHDIIELLIIKWCTNTALPKFFVQIPVPPDFGRVVWYIDDSCSHTVNRILTFAKYRKGAKEKEKKKAPHSYSLSKSYSSADLTSPLIPEPLLIQIKADQPSTSVTNQSL
ncbi:MAG: hypothetical protein ACI81W_003600, partial [Saprospiraceae bacterium]